MTTASFKAHSYGKDSKFTLIVLLGLLIFTACTKTPVKPPVPPTEDKAYLQITVTGMPFSSQPFFALLSIDDKAGQNIVVNKKVSLENINGVYKTDKVELSKGEFSLSKFLVVTASDTAVYATPRANTTKAATVEHPLSLQVAVNTTGINNISTQVVKVEETDLPASFGYSSDDFGFRSYLSVKVTLQIKVGRVIYDSLPGKLRIDATGENNSHWIREIDIRRGATTIQVPDQYSTYSFTSDKWNTLSQKIVNRAGLQSNMTIFLEGVRDSKRLVEEKTYVENAAGLVPDTRTIFLYNGANKLAEIRNYQKSVQQPELMLTNTYFFQYVDNHLDSIKSFAPGTGSTGFTAFSYQDGRILSISNLSYDQHTGVAFEYRATGENEIVNADYLFHNGNSMFYRFFTKNGNRTSDQALSSTGGGESGVYEFDDNINPKHQLGWEDIFMSNYSKNNLVKEEKSYSGSFPTSVPYKFEYQYDNDGYPVELYTSYKGFTSQAHLFRIKTVYTYQ